MSDHTISDNYTLGVEREEPEPTPHTLRCVLITGGRGGWAYYTDVLTRLVVLADEIYNPHAAHFAGQLTKPYASDKPEPAWIVVKGWQPPARERRIYIEDEDAGLPRLERR
jgi:hypothetical protein